MSTLFEQIIKRNKNLPAEPGCYLMKDRQGKIFYIGKAINLKKRIKSYFTGQDTRTFVKWLKHILADIEIIVVRNETEALILERNLIKKHNPRFNILLKDDKNFILLRLDAPSTLEKSPKHLRFPKLEIVRKSKKDKARYFGPYPNASKLRETLHLINKNFQLRTCSDKIIDNRTRPCIQYQIGRCSAPCVLNVPNYDEEMQNVVYLLLGKTNLIAKRLEQDMWKASQNEQFELASKIRNQLDAIRTSLTNQAASIAEKNSNQDIFALSRQGSLLEIVQLHIRLGQITKTDHFSFDNQEFPSDELLLSFLNQLYDETDDEQLPETILTSLELKEESHLLINTLSERKNKKIRLHTPKQGKLSALVNIAQKNADAALIERIKNLEHKQASLKSLQQLLKLNFSPKQIECFDVSLFQGTDAVASKICFIDGEPAKKLYRKYNIKTVEGMNDFAMLFEVLMRRLKKGLAENNLPDLLLVDGGKGQLSVAIRACKELGITIDNNKFMVAGIAKARTQTNAEAESNVAIEKSEDFVEVKHSYERLFIPNVKDPILLKAHSKERYLIERIRDEAHRFAITTHRAKRKKRTLTSKIQDIPNVGAKRLKLLVKHLGSAQNIINAEISEIAKIPGVSTKLAEAIY
ncbi:MAG: excinuclease ABC subunit UvrC, partial [bacterium]|nr:excinuclease ABC subunit UvrC [bacterium]